MSTIAVTTRYLISLRFVRSLTLVEFTTDYRVEDTQPASRSSRYPGVGRRLDGQNKVFVYYIIRFPVNPYLEEALGEEAYPDLPSVPGPVDMVLIFRRPEFVPPVVEQAIEIDADVVWMQLGIVNEAAAEEAREAGLEVMMDSCVAVDHRELFGGR